jgi:hypothetical protein
MLTTLFQYAISKTIPWQDLHRVFGITELTVQDWMRYLTSATVLSTVETSITLSPAFAERILGVLSKIWMNLRADQSSQVVSMLKPLACIPTKKGMVTPTEAYLPKVTLFEDCTSKAESRTSIFLRAELRFSTYYYYSGKG